MKVVLFGFSVTIESSDGARRIFNIEIAKEAQSISGAEQKSMSPEAAFTIVEFLTKCDLCQISDLDIFCQICRIYGMYGIYHLHRVHQIVRFRRAYIRFHLGK